MADYVEVGDTVEVSWVVGAEDEDDPIYTNSNINIEVTTPSKIRSNVDPTSISNILPGIWFIRLNVNASEIGSYKCTLCKQLSSCLTIESVSSQSFKAIELSNVVQTSIPHFL